MTKKQNLKIINNKIDVLILAGEINTSEYNRLIKLHAMIRR